LKKTKAVKVLLISVIVLLTINSASTILQSPRATNANRGTSTFHQVLVSAQVEPDVTLVSEQTGGTNTTIVTGIFRNNEYVDVYGVATATVTANASFSEKLSSSRTLIMNSLSV
jgi:hypothetical protein